MKLFKKAKKGFTLIELVVVIAVIAILAAVSVVSFISINNKAKESHDNQIIDQVNLSLKADETLNGKPKTMHRALEALKEDGFLPANFGDLRGTAKDYTFAYSLKENKFVALKSGKISYPSGVGEHANHELWKITESTTGLDDGYSYYLRGEDKTGTVKVEAGFDVGDNKGIKEIKYTNPTGNRNSVIRTDGGTLTINAPEDTVKHFGNADSVNIVKIANASYHENGTVPFIQVSQGRIEIESSGDVNTIHVANVQTVNSDESISKQSNVFSQDVSLTLNGKDVKLSRDTIGTAISSAVLVCEVQEQSSSSSEYIWLVGDGTIENHKVYVTSTSTAPNTSVDSTTTTDNASDAAIAIANNAVNIGTAENPVYEAAESGVSAADAAQAALLKGEGTEAKPFEIHNGNDWYNLLMKYEGLYMGSSTSGLYVVLKGDIDITGYDITELVSYPRNFHLDGNGFTMKNFETSIWGEDGTLYLTNTFTNLKLENCHSSDNSLFGGTQNSNTASVTFNNVDLNNCSAVGGAYQYYDGSATATFIDCDVTNTNVLGGYMASGGFIGNISTGVIVIDHCSFGGSVVSTQSACGGFIGQSANYDANKITIKDSTIIAGTVIRNVAGGNVAAFNAHTGTQDYAQFNNSFYGTLETTGNKYKQGTDAATKTYEPICTSADFALNSDEGTLTYNGSAGLGKITVQVYVTDDYIYNGEYYGGYNWYVCDPIKANDVLNGTTISGIPVITDFYNVVSSTDTPVGLQTTDTTYVDEIHNGTFYFDAQTYSWGHYMLGGTYKNGAAVEPTSLNVYIKVTVYDNSGSLVGVVSGATLKYSVDLSNHGN